VVAFLVSNVFFNVIGVSYSAVVVGKIPWSLVVMPLLIQAFDYFADMHLFGMCLVVNNSNQILAFNQLDAHQYAYINTLMV